MRAYGNMPIDEFVAQLRDVAIAAKARPAVIDMIDSIDTSDKDEEIEKIAGQLDDMTGNRNDLADELRAIEKALCDETLDDDWIKATLVGIANALSRSG